MAETEETRKVKEVTQDGQTVKFEDANEYVEREKWTLAKKARKSPFACLSRVKISTQGPER